MIPEGAAYQLAGITISSAEWVSCCYGTLRAAARPHGSESIKAIDVWGSLTERKNCMLDGSVMGFCHSQINYQLRHRHMTERDRRDLVPMKFNKSNVKSKFEMSTMPSIFSQMGCRKKRRPISGSWDNYDGILTELSRDPEISTIDINGPYQRTI